MDKSAEEYEAWLRERCPNVLDEAHAYGWTANGDIFYMHRCKEGKWQLGTINVTKPIHTLVEKSPLHTEPSILCTACEDHGYIRNGVWVRA